MTVTEKPAIRVLDAVRIIALQLSRESYTGLFSSMTKEAKLVLPKNAKLPMLVTEAGISILVNPEHPENAWLPMLVTKAGIPMLINPLQLEKA